MDIRRSGTARYTHATQLINQKRSISQCSTSIIVVNGPCDILLVQVFLP